MTEEAPFLRTALHGRHVAAGAVVADIAGWAMPLSYRGALDEAAATRSRAGVFDLSHQGRFRISGHAALELLERVCSCDVAHQEDDTAAYCLLCNERGGILADTWLLRLANAWLLITDAANRAKVAEHLAAHAVSLPVKIDDQTEKTAQIAVVGAAAPTILQMVLPIDVASMPSEAVKVGSLLIASYVAMRSSYLGQWGLEVILPNIAAGRAWDFITAKAGANAIQPAGLGAWDILRIEAGWCAYGHELNETIDPVAAGLDWSVDSAGDFVGSDALRNVRSKPSARRRAGLIMRQMPPAAAGRIPRQGSAIIDDGDAEVGAVTSATYSPALDAMLAMAYLSSGAAVIGNRLNVQIEGGRCVAEVAQLPFYK